MISPGPDLVGQQVCNQAQPEWGVGKVLRVQRVGEAWRVSVQFHGGHRYLLVPPARLVDPRELGSQAESGWIDKLAGSDANARLRGLPDEIRFFLGLPLQKFSALLGCYEWNSEPRGLEAWARSQTETVNPLGRWTRDELSAAFEEYCRQRNDALHETLSRLQKSGDLPAARALLSASPDHVRRSVLDAAPALR